MSFTLSPPLQSLIETTRAAGKTIVLASGVFDVLHEEHRNFLLAARAAGDVLVVGLESDQRVREIKGPSRPIHPQTQRQQNLEEWKIADAVFVLPEDFGDPTVREAFLAALRPDILAVSSHTPHLENKARLIARFGGELKVVYEHNPAVSSTRLLGQE